VEQDFAVAVEPLLLLGHRYALRGHVHGDQPAAREGSWLRALALPDEDAARDEQISGASRAAVRNPGLRVRMSPHGRHPITPA